MKKRIGRYARSAALGLSLPAMACGEPAQPGPVVDAIVQHPLSQDQEKPCLLLPVSESAGYHVAVTRQSDGSRDLFLSTPERHFYDHGADGLRADQNDLYEWEEGWVGGRARSDYRVALDAVQDMLETRRDDWIRC